VAKATNLYDWKYQYHLSPPSYTPLLEINRMLPLQIKRHVEPNVDPKQVLRAHIDQLPEEKQREFVAAAFQLLGDRIDLSKVGRGSESELLS
jgi:hypothetical protein